MSAVRTALAGVVSRIEAISCDTRYDRVQAYTYDDGAHDEADLQHTRAFCVVDTGRRAQIGAQGADDSPSETVAEFELRVVYTAGEDADELRKVIAEDVDRLRYTLQAPTHLSGDGAILRTVGEAVIDLPDGEDDQTILTMPVAVRYRPNF